MPALEGLVNELMQADSVGEIVVGLDRAREDEFRYALKYFSRLPQPLRILSNDGPRLRGIDRQFSDFSLAPLVYPVANPSFRYQFCKGYYARVADNKLNDRVCRLLVSPLLQSLKKVFGYDEFFEYLIPRASAR